ncbi:hypothetical protein GS399_14905 [Pedobacter sp. HMF7647]|uniref:Uncharacterized protein n=1 Tax=Hufsiella arboris TaxID=2695275 RepID=A0A7K1YCG7_9SPHI|nr:hypothetical protein [Hufsiella arboris]MXV52265.1 hypothetical protein [Hufsiella arboris]
MKTSQINKIRATLKGLFVLLTFVLISACGDPKQKNLNEINASSLAADSINFAADCSISPSFCTTDPDHLDEIDPTIPISDTQINHLVNGLSDYPFLKNDRALKKHTNLVKILKKGLFLSKASLEQILHDTQNPNIKGVRIIFGINCRKSGGYVHFTAIYAGDDGAASALAEDSTQTDVAKALVGKKFDGVPPPGN